MSTTVADAIAEALLRHGITEAFGQSLPTTVFLAAEKRGIRQISYRTENAGGAMADAYARISNRVSVVGAQNGPAATLLVAPLSEAMKASVPVLALVQDVPTSHRDRNAFQELDHFELFKSCTKWVRQLNDASRVDDYVDMAITAATTGRPGPVVLLLPKDVLNQEVPATAPSRELKLGTYPLDRSRPDDASVQKAAALMAGAKRPVIIAGGGVHLSGAANQLAELQEQACLPVATTNMGKGSVDELHPLSVGVVGNFMGKYGMTTHQRHIIADADVILLVGTKTNENGTDSWTLLPKSATYIHIDVDGTEIGRNYESMRLVGDARLALEDLSTALSTGDLSRRSKARADIEDALAKGREDHRLESKEVTSSDASPIRPERVMAELNDLLTEDTIVVADASYSSVWLCNYLRSRRPGQRFLTPRGLAGLGWGLPMAIGAKAASPTSQVVCISGDGGFGHVWAELETAVREKLPLTLIVLNNSILGFQKHAELISFSAHTTAIDFEKVDHAAIAEAVGAHAVRVDDPARLASALREAMESPVITLVEVRTDPEAHPPITFWDGHEDKLAGA